MKKRILSLLLCIVMCFSMVSMLSGCKSEKAEAFVIMTELLDGLFNPFFYTSQNDGTIVGMTQIGMLSSKLVDGKVEVAYGENEAVVTKDYEIVENDDGTVSYYFVVKNGIKFSDGHPLTMEDILFNYYVYLDPAYTGSSTLYSTKILGLSAYRNQIVGDSDVEDSIAAQAATRAEARINELRTLFTNNKELASSGEFGYKEMLDAIDAHSLSDGYKEALYKKDGKPVTVEDLKKDYEHTLELFREELESDYQNASESYTDTPYKEHKDFEDEIFCFMFHEGYARVEYELDENNKPDRSKIKKTIKEYSDTITTREAAIDYVYKDKIGRSLDEILTIWATAGNLATEYTAEAKSAILHESIGSDGALLVPNISGIVSLGHTDEAGSKITINDNEYTIASGHNEDGTPTKADEYDVLKITIEGIDPKAIWNFAISVAPQHYYGEGSPVGVDIANNQFGVAFADYSFMSGIIQRPRNNKMPMGAGPYKVTDKDTNDNPKESDFYRDNVVYFKASKYFETVGEGIQNAKIEKVRYQIVSSNNAVAALSSGSVHYISPALTALNYDELTKMKSKGFEMITTDQLGYGYIGVNASKIKDLNLRKAIMCAMNTQLALDYYRTNTAERLFWNMSKVSWAYPTGEDENDNGKDYPQVGAWSKEAAITNIRNYMSLANVGEGDSKLKVTFTIAGATTDHPCYKVFRDAAALLNELGWEVKVITDSQALTKISTGSLEVWAAAWSSALDPDMYQVYHKDSTATSTKAWGYDFIKKSGSDEERDILDKMAEKIDAARETNDQAERSKLYKDAMGYVLDLAVELPVYQRDVLYAYNANVISSDSLPDEVNPYSNPLERIWELEFANK